MTRTESSPEPHKLRAVTSRHHSNEGPPQRTPDVTGVVELRLEELHYGSVPDGAVIRVHLPDDVAYIPTGDLTRLASVTWGAKRVEIVGASGSDVADAVRTVRRDHAEYARSEAAQWDIV